MLTISGNIQQPGTQAAMKEQRAREAAQAMQEYEAEKLATQARIERLRTLRLASEAISPPPPVKKRKTK